MGLEDLITTLRNEVQRLEREFTIELPQKIKAARELGDITENGEYETLKDRQGFVQARLSFLQRRLSALSSIDLTSLPRDRIAFGSRVTLRGLEGGKERVYQIVSPEEADSAKGWVSVASPIGKSLLGRVAGDEVTIRTPGGEQTYEIAKVVTLHDLPREDLV